MLNLIETVKDNLIQLTTSVFGSEPVKLTEEEILNNMIQSTREAFEMSGISTRIPYHRINEIEELTVESPEYRRAVPPVDPTIVKLFANNAGRPSVFAAIDPGGDRGFDKCLVFYPDRSTIVPIREVISSYRPYKDKILDFSILPLNKTALLASNMFSDGWYAYLIHVLGWGDEGIFHNWITGRIGHFTPSYNLWKMSEAGLWTKSYDDRYAMYQCKTLTPINAPNVLRYRDHHSRPDLQVMLPTAETLETYFPRELRREWYISEAPRRLPFGYKMISMTERTVPRLVSAVFPDFIMNYNSHVMQVEAFVNNWNCKYLHKPIIATAYDVKTHLLYSGSPIGEDAHSIDPLEKEHEGYYGCGTIGRRYMIIKESHSRNTLVGGNVYPYEDRNWIQCQGFKTVWRPARMDMPGTIENQAWESLKERLVKKGYPEDYIKSLEVVSKEGKPYQGRFFMPDYLDVDWYFAFFKGFDMPDVYRDYDERTGITYYACKVHVDDPRFKALIENRAYGTIDMQFDKYIGNRDGKIIGYKTFSDKLTSSERRELCGASLDENDCITVVIGQDNVNSNRLSAWSEFISSLGTDRVAVRNFRSIFAWGLNLSHEDPRCTSITPVQSANWERIKNWDHEKMMKNNHPWYTTTRPESKPDKPLTVGDVQELADRIWKDVQRYRRDPAVDIYPDTADAKEYSLIGSSQELYQERRAIPHAVRPNWFATPFPNVQSRADIVKSLIETVSHVASYVDYSNRLKFFVDVPETHPSVEEIIKEVISSRPHID